MPLLTMWFFVPLVTPYDAMDNNYNNITLPPGKPGSPQYRSCTTSGNATFINLSDMFQYCLFVFTPVVYALCPTADGDMRPFGLPCWSSGGTTEDFFFGGGSFPRPSTQNRDAPNTAKSMTLTGLACWLIGCMAVVGFIAGVWSFTATGCSVYTHDRPGIPSGLYAPLRENDETGECEIHGCWQAITTEYPDDCDDYILAGYTCVGDKCAIVSTGPRLFTSSCSGTIKISRRDQVHNPFGARPNCGCAAIAPFGYILDEATGTCVEPPVDDDGAD